MLKFAILRGALWTRAAKLEFQNASQSRYRCARNFKLQIKIYIISLEWLDCEARFGSARLNFSLSQNLCSRIKFTTNFAWRAWSCAAPKPSLEPKFYDAKLIDFNLRFVRKSEAGARHVCVTIKLKEPLWRRRSAICSKKIKSYDFGS